MNRITFLLFLVFVLFHTSEAFTCGCFHNNAMSSIQAIMCAGNGYRVPKITGWTHLNSWFAIDCKYCGSFNCSSSKTEQQLADKKETVFQIAKSNPAPIVFENPDQIAIITETNRLKPTEMVALEDQLESGNPIPCCCYASKENFYAEHIHCSAYNPNYRTTCKSTDLGKQLFGHWYVNEMYNQCYFITRFTLSDE
eukprot:TRINITY_DN12556_c0_g1_i1.p1 TRINITY_DN12556_c0_g1~~TRINITY_DN12556_c0_g1_i1.p1  ORF type:complete len:196 (-),score=17.11 TRINITY_DN12556_c0_g1_i1:57-644(-)